MSPSPWDDVDEWAAEQRAKQPPRVHATECAETGKRISSDAARTQQALARIARGFHPFGFPLREPRGETCGSCVHLREHRPGEKRFWKCVLRGVTHGPATDVRKKWPACVKWES